MKVTRGQIVARGWAGQCSNCGGATLFPPGAGFKISERCAQCGLKFDRGDGFFLGPFVINYTVTVAFLIVPIILLNAARVIGPGTTLACAGGVALGVPVLLYRRSWSWWLMAYFYFLPQKLPANRDAQREDEEE